LQVCMHMSEHLGYKADTITSTGGHRLQCDNCRQFQHHMFINGHVTQTKTINKATPEVNCMTDL
jgi:hypothetical protein